MAAPLATVPRQEVTTKDSSASLRIAMVAPPYFAVPPDGYGGVEALVADLVDALVDRGHHVTLIGAGTHGTAAQRFLQTSGHPPADRLGEVLPEIAHAARVAELLEECDVDVVHDHTAAGPLLARGRLTPTVVTVHGPVDGVESTYYRALGDTVRLVAISDAQRALAPDLCWAATVHNAIDVATFPYQRDKEPFALFLGRFHPQKGPHLAIDAARAAGLPIVLAGKCNEPVEQAYFDELITPRLGPDVTLYGVADAAAKRDLLARAQCLVFPICWEEPFGLVMIEAMACGTPVVALRRGSVPEVVVDGRTGAICDHADELADGIARARRLDPADCRAHAEDCFDVPAMAAGYERVYRQVLAERREPRVATVSATGQPWSAISAAARGSSRLISSSSSAGSRAS
ncbi:MAG TPA: glycosyltransferase family 4 protein [Mycobacteriales bacterium]|nr:glycosyltransferase family 4 protein [Mycobacteriales bacterium]